MASEKTICVVEDNVPIRKLFCTLLKRAGYATVDFGEGKPAMEWLEANKSDIVILDILLPDSNGTELIGTIRSMNLNKESKVVAITGFAASNDRDKFLKLGFDGYLSKPINTSTFVSDLENIIQ